MKNRVGRAIVALIFLVVPMEVLRPIEISFKRRMRNISFYVGFENIEDVAKIVEVIQRQQAQIFDIDVEHTKKKSDLLPGAIFDIKMKRGHASHSEMLSSIAELPCVHSIKELIQ